MFLRDLPDLTLAALGDKLDVGAESITVAPGEAVIDHDSGELRIKDREPLPLHVDNLAQIGAFVDIPAAVVKRLPNDLRDHLLNQLLLRQNEASVFRLTDTDVVGIHSVRSSVIDPRQVVEVAMRVLSPEADVVDFAYTGDSFGFEAIVPAGYSSGIGGDPRVNDITHGGLRFGQNIKQNLTPWVAGYNYRLICTNGMEVPHEIQRVEGRGNSVNEVLQQLEAAAQLAFGLVEEDIRHFYELRDVVVESPERQLNRMAREAGLSDRMRLDLIEAVPSIADAGDDVSMFDLVNLVTNTANDPTLRRPVRRKLEIFGGAVINDHAARCRSCASKLN